MTEVWVVVDCGCYECGDAPHPVGIFLTEAEAEAAAVQRDTEPGSGQGPCAVFEMRLPEG